MSAAILHELRKLLLKVEGIEKAVFAGTTNHRYNEWMNRDDLANPQDPEHLKIGKDRLSRIANSGLLKIRKAGRQVEFLREDVRKYKDGKIKIPNRNKKSPVDTPSNFQTT